MKITTVTRTGQPITGPVMEWVQSIADRAYDGVGREEGVMETERAEICAFKGPVPRHIDQHPGTGDMVICGLVLRSDGHKLHTGTVPDGIPLNPGDIYQIDVRDPHWTTCPSEDSQLVFSVYIMHPDGRKPKKLAHDMFFTLLVASVETRRAA